LTEEKSLIENLHFTNIKKAEGYFEIKKKNYRVDTPVDLLANLLSDIDQCSVEKEIQHKQAALFKDSEEKLFN